MKPIELNLQSLNGPAYGFGGVNETFYGLLAWTDLDRNIYCMRSDALRTGEKWPVGGVSKHAPAVAITSDGTYYVAWIGAGEYLQIASSNDGKHWSNARQVDNEQSDYAPALYVDRKTLTIAWTGLDGRLNFKESVDGGRSWRNKVTTQQILNAGPALGGVIGNDSGLIVSWSGKQDHLYVGTYSFPTLNEITPLKNETESRPAVISLPNFMPFIAFQGMRKHWLSLTVPNRSGRRIVRPYVCMEGPAVGAVKGLDGFVWFWTGLNNQIYMMVDQLEFGQDSADNSSAES